MLNSPCPDFTLPATENALFSLTTAAKPLLIYFYPKDNTPGCTNEAIDFREHYAAFRALGCEIVGISRDSLKSHDNFRNKFSLPFALLSDTDEVACMLFGVMKMKNMYGKQVRGIERSTFLIDRHDVVVGEWRGIKVPGHVQNVLAHAQALLTT